MIKQSKQIKKRLPAAQLLALGFFLPILVDNGLLTLPLFSNGGHGTNFIGALSTATSVVCVTGSTVLNAAEHWNSTGQFLIILLIEIGGLGFMMIPVLCLTLIKKKVGLSTRIILKEALNLEEVPGMMKLILYILRLASVIQLVGTVALSFVFVPESGWLRGIWYSLLHVISNFCDTRLDLLGDNLVNHQQSVYLIMVVSALIISGGLGSIVWRDLLEYHQKEKIMIHPKIVSTVTGILLLGGFVVFFFTEHNEATLAEGNMFQRLTNTFFMSATLRTAGYYSVGYFRMSRAGLILIMFLIHIGGTSGSTTGGLKTVTLGVLLIQVRSMLKGRTGAEAFGCTIRQDAVLRTLTLFFVTLMLCVVAIMILSVAETIPKTFGIGYIVLEVFPAFGTVGFTMGLTPNLTAIGELIIIVLIHIGRVGALTTVLSLMTKAQRTQSEYRYPEESVMIG